MEVKFDIDDFHFHHSSVMVLVAYFKDNNKLVEAQRIEERTNQSTYVM